MNYDLVIVGSGLFGATIAQKMATEFDKKVLIIEKRNHIGGNCYSYFDRKTNIEIHKYGLHMFHIYSDKVWEYIKQFTKIIDYTHYVYTTHFMPDTKREEVFHMPINLHTIEQFYRKKMTPDEAKKIIQKFNKNISKNSNLEEKGISMVGKDLFNAFFRDYTKKQWGGIPASKLPADIIVRLPIRYDYEPRLFPDKKQGLPDKGFLDFFQNMLTHKNIEIKVNTNFNDIKKSIKKVPIIFTGPIDSYFNYKLGRLGWRSLAFKKEVINLADFQGCTQMNFPDENIPWLRIVEYKHFRPDRKNFSKKKTVIVKEFSTVFKPKKNDPYYPINTLKDKKILKGYEKLAQKEFKERKVLFGGRLGEYKYYDMENTILSAFKMVDKIVETFF
ncbi:MAG: NAD(P)-binding protein [Candidatus Shapirobacteria bacterium]|nr:NAD(P)-binding protein [Candidatus Shapirobacteria bacterium]